MVAKTSKHGRSYDIDGRRLIWHPEDDDGEQGNLPDVTIPLRLKMKTVLQFADRDMDSVTMSEMLKAILPESQKDTIGEMDVNDFQDMFVTWQNEYNTLTGGSLGESSVSPPSSETTEEPSSTTSGVVSVSG